MSLFSSTIADLTSGNAKGSLKKAEEFMRTVQGWSKKKYPFKEEIVCFLHSCIGNAMFDLGDIDKALQHHKKDLNLAKQWWEARKAEHFESTFFDHMFINLSHQQQTSAGNIQGFGEHRSHLCRNWTVRKSHRVVGKEHIYCTSKIDSH